MKNDKLYYDDTCPVCNAEMSKLSRLHDDGLELVRLTSIPEDERESMYSELHLKTEDGEWVKGLEANIRAWQHTKYRKVVGLMLHPAFKWAVTLGYRVWLVWYQWRRKRRLTNDQ